MKCSTKPVTESLVLYIVIIYTSRKRFIIHLIPFNLSIIDQLTLSFVYALVLKLPVSMIIFSDYLFSRKNIKI